MCGRIGIALLAVSLAGAASAGNPVGEIVLLVRSAIARGQPDQDVARALHKMRPSERVDDGTIEDLRIEGAGPRTVAELERLRDASRTLPKPAALPAAREMPPPSAEEQSRVWEAARDNSLNYVDSLPDFICTEVVRRYRDLKGQDNWRLTDTLLLKLTYFERKEDYKLVSVNGRPVMKTYEEAGGAVTKGEFGSLLRQVFDPTSKTVFEWNRWTNLRGRQTHVYFFRISIFDATYRMDFGTAWGAHATALVGQHGYVYIDRDSHMVVRIAAEADSIPPKFPVQKATSLLDYDFTDVGGRQYLLPLRAEIHLGTGLLSHKNEVEFRGYQKFSSDATISFDK
ncbi:MAG: hypothetical protein LAP87_11765 [Acidobacteriia bacterium]|nr:hypothetical protein [Terriglobia bacterium]